MKKNISILTVTIILTIIIFSISTYIQKKLINYEPTISCLVLNTDIHAKEKINEEMFVLKDLPLSLVSTIKVVQSYDEIKDLYAKDNIYRNQIVIKEQFDTKENLSIFEIEPGMEKISIKIQNPENGVSYAIRDNTFINLYVTLRSDYAKDFLNDNDRLSIGDEFDGYTVIELISNVKVLATFDSDGAEVKDTPDSIIDSIMIPVTSEGAKQINLLRDIGTFNITGVNNESILY